MLSEICCLFLFFGFSDGEKQRKGFAKKAREKPNVVFVLFDDMGWTDVG